LAARDDNLAAVYAQALLELAFEKGVHAEILAELRAFGQALERDPQFRAFLNTPKIPREAKKDLVTRVFGTRVSDFTLNFLKVTIDKRRQGHLPSMITAFIAGYHERLNELVVTVTSAVPLEQPQKQKLSGAQGALRARGRPGGAGEPAYPGGPRGAGGRLAHRRVAAVAAGDDRGAARGRAVAEPGLL